MVDRLVVMIARLLSWLELGRDVVSAEVAIRLLLWTEVIFVGIKHLCAMVVAGLVRMWAFKVLLWLRVMVVFGGVGFVLLVMFFFEMISRVIVRGDSGLVLPQILLHLVFGMLGVLWRMILLHKVTVLFMICWFFMMMLLFIVVSLLWVVLPLWMVFLWVVFFLLMMRVMSFFVSMVFIIIVIVFIMIIVFFIIIFMFTEEFINGFFCHKPC